MDVHVVFKPYAFDNWDSSLYCTHNLNLTQLIGTFYEILNVNASPRGSMWE